MTLQDLKCKQRNTLKQQHKHVFRDVEDMFWFWKKKKKKTQRFRCYLPPMSMTQSSLGTKGNAGWRKWILLLRNLKGSSSLGLAHSSQGRSPEGHIDALSPLFQCRLSLRGSYPTGNKKSLPFSSLPECPRSSLGRPNSKCHRWSPHRSYTLI